MKLFEKNLQELENHICSPRVSHIKPRFYARAVQIRDDEGEVSNAAGLTVNNYEVPNAGGQTANVNVGVVGGPDVITTALALREIPVFAGAGINPGGKTTYIGAGIRHSF